MLIIDIICKINVNKDINRMVFMTTRKIKSNSLDVQETISELTGIQSISNFKTVDFSESNIQSVVNGISETKRMANTKEK